MGGIKFRTLHDLGKLDAHVGVTCNGCGRRVVLARQGVLEWFAAKGFNPAIEAAGHYFRCTECGHKGARIDAVAVNEEKPLERPRVIWER